MILIADSGSTKTHWRILNNDQSSIVTSGINPFYQSSDDIFNLLEKEIGSLKEVTEIYFYGAGCINISKANVVRKALLMKWPQSSIYVNSDLLATCLATSANEYGVCCILGTGSNSCLFNGVEIEDQISPLGYILGDEGSGAHLGKMFINGLLKRQFSKSIEQCFMSEFKMDKMDILNQVYQKELPNRFLASFTPFIKSQIHHQCIHEMVINCFEEFIKRNILQYKKVDEMNIHFTGSIAYCFKQQLIISLEKHKLKIGNVYKQPMDGLIDYYSKKNL